MTTEPAIRLTSAEDARRFVEEGGHAHVKVGVADIDGILRGKYLSAATSSSRRSRRASASATWCSAGIPTTSSTTTSTTPAGTRPIPTRRAHPARHRPRDAVRGRHAVLPVRVRRARPRRSARAGSCGACSPSAAGMGFEVTVGARVRVLRLRRDAGIGAREGLPQPEADDAGLLRLLGAAHLGPCRVLPRAARHCETMDMAHRGPAHRDRARACSKPRSASTRRCAPPTRRRCSRPSPRCWRSAAAYGDLHGEVVAGLAGPERPHPPVAARTRPAGRSSTTPRPSAA